MIQETKTQTTEQKLEFYYKQIQLHLEAKANIKPDMLYKDYFLENIKNRIGLYNSKIMALKLKRRQGEVQNRLLT